MISFGINGIVGWGPTFVSRELQLTSAAGGGAAGEMGAHRGDGGHACSAALLADWLRRRYETARVIAVALGCCSAGRWRSGCSPSGTRQLFQAVFVVAFFCLSWYNGPMTAVIFDVVPARISATVAGAYLLFIHLAGDAIALPLVGTLSDRFGLDRADPAPAAGRDRGRYRRPGRGPNRRPGHAADRAAGQRPHGEWVKGTEPWRRGPPRDR